MPSPFCASWIEMRMLGQPETSSLRAEAVPVTTRPSVILRSPTVSGSCETLLKSSAKNLEAASLGSSEVQIYLAKTHINASTVSNGAAL